jgi:hypothetical protein
MVDSDTQIENTQLGVVTLTSTSPAMRSEMAAEKRTARISPTIQISSTMSNYDCCHCEERSDEAISTVAYMLKAGDCFAEFILSIVEGLAMTSFVALRQRIDIVKLARVHDHGG